MPIRSPRAPCWGAEAGGLESALPSGSPPHRNMPPDTGSAPCRGRRKGRSAAAPRDPSPSRNPPGLGARAAALEVLIAVLHEGRSLGRCLEERPPMPEARDNALAREICYGVLRHRQLLEEVLGALLHRRMPARDRDLRIALLIGLYQLMCMRVGPHAAVSTSAGLARHLGKPRATALVNAVLRTFIRRRPALAGLIARAGRAEGSHPRWLAEAIREAWPKRWRDILRANDAHPPMTLRVNAARLRREAYVERLDALGIAAQAAPHCEHGVTLARPRDVAQVPGFLAGEVSVQDAAAQLAAALLDPAKGERVLDACAAPGGKSAHLLETRPSLRLTALDIDPARSRRIADTLQRLGLEATVRCADAGEAREWWDGLPYHRILLDAPCSASGVIRRHPDLKWLRRSGDPERLASLAFRLLERVWPLLARGGSLLYATCSILPTENDDVIARFLADRRDAKVGVIEAPWGCATHHGRQILPGDDGMDGFYYARLVKV